MLYGKRPTNASGAWPEPTQIKALPAPIAQGNANESTHDRGKTATAREIPIEIISFILAIAVVLFLHSESANFSFSRY